MMRIYVKVMAGIFIAAFVIAINTNLSAQGGPPPPPPGEGHGQTSNLPPEGGNAPVGNGVAFLVSLGLGYGIATIMKHRKTAIEEA
ncbi:MAG: hypothetical protein V1775_15955 [Bacteroidota bacterium]